MAEKKRKRKARKQLTANQQAYKKEINRIKRYLREKKKLGLEVPDFTIPEMPKRVTQKKLREIREIKGRDLRKKLVPIKLQQPPKIPVEDAVQERMPSPEQIQKEDQKFNYPRPPVQNLPEKAPEGIANLAPEDEAYIIISNFLAQVNGMPGLVVLKVNAYIEECVNIFGEDDTAAALQAMPSKVTEFLTEWGSDIDIEEFNAEFIQYLPGDTPKGLIIEIEDAIAEMHTGEWFASHWQNR